MNLTPTGGSILPPLAFPDHPSQWVSESGASSLALDNNFSYLQNRQGARGAVVHNVLLEKDGKVDVEQPHIFENGVMQCRYCNYTTDKKANWYKHKRKHTGE